MTIAYSKLSTLVKQIDEINLIIEHTKQCNSFLACIERADPRQSKGMKITGKSAEIAQFALLREFTQRRDNLVAQISGQLIDTTA